MKRQHSQFEGHHHDHHHHEHVEYRRPSKLDTNLGLFALKKLNAIDPTMLSESDKRLLQPVAPGAITYLLHGALLSTAGLYTYSAWRNIGFSFLIKRKTLIPFVALVGLAVNFQFVANYARELIPWAYARAALVNRSKQKYGEKFLLDVLEPTFRLP